MPASPVVLLTCTVVAACAMSDAGADRVTVRDSSGIRIVETPAPVIAWSLSPDPALRVGTVDGEATHQLHLVRFAARMSDGGVVIVDGGSREVRFFDSGGRHVLSAGRRGAGPGEFQNMSAATLHADSVLVFDSGNRRITVLTREAGVVRDFPARLPAGTRLIGRDAQGDLLAVVEPAPTLPAKPGYTYVQEQVAVVRVAEATVDTAFLLPGAERADWMEETGSGARTMNMPMPFGYRPDAAAVSDGIAAIARDGHGWAMLGPTGAVRAIVRSKIVIPEPLTQDHRSRLTGFTREWAEQRNLPIEENVQAANDRLAVVPSTHRVPAYDRLLATSGGEVWARHYVMPWAQNEPQTWTIHDGSGVAMSRVVTPARMVVMSVGTDHVTGVLRDELDVEYVVSFSIVRRASDADA